MLNVKFKVESCQVLEDPKDSARKKYLLYVDVDKFPDNIPMKCNPREQRLTTRVAKTISGSFLNPNKGYFHILNRGITVLATNVNVKNSVISLDFADLNVHGNIDGGHTYKILSRDKHLTNQKQFAFVEILEGYDDIFTEIAAARNTSVQVNQSSIMELEQKYTLIKEVLQGTELEYEVAYKQNEKKHVTIEEVIGLFYMFDVIRFSKTSVDQPISSAAHKFKAGEHYAREIKTPGNAFEMMEDIIPGIIELCNYIEINMPKAYDSLTTKKSYFGRVSGITSLKREGKVQHAKFSPSTKVDYIIPKGLLYPIVAAFRFLVKINATTGKFEWLLSGTALYSFVDKILPKLTEMTVSRIRNNNRTIIEMARDKDHWTNLYKEVELQYLRDTAVI